MTSQQFYFIRHSFWGDETELNKLKEKRKIAFHYTDQFFKDAESPNRYKKFTSDVKPKNFDHVWYYFKNLGTNGGYVMVEYEDNDEYFYIGEVNSNQEFERWPFKHESINRNYHTLQANNLKQFKYSDFPVLLATRPPFHVICHVNQYTEAILRKIYFNEKIEPAIELLHPKVLEQLIENYLRSNLAAEQLKLKYSILKTGKNLKSIDICGRTYQNKLIYVQISYLEKDKSDVFINKVKSLKSFNGSNKILVFACNCSENHFEDGINYISISKVFNQFKNNKDYSEMVLDMCGLNYSQPS